MRHTNGKGELHRTNGPAVVCANGDQEWWVDGKRHRINKPAIEYRDGSRQWWVDGKLHRTDGPAIVYEDGHREWWVNGKPHRIDGPAIQDADGDVWYIDGEFIKKVMTINLADEYNKLRAKHRELREATTDLLNAIDGLFPTDGPVKVRVRAALREKE